MPRRRKSPVQIETTEPHLCDPSLRLRILRSVPFFQDVSDEQLAEINTQFREQGYEPGEFIYFAGDPATRLLVLAEGRVRLLRDTPQGKQIMLDLLVPGETLGELTGREDQLYPDTAQAVTPVCALAISVENLRKLLAQYPSVALRVLDTVHQRLLEAQETIRQISAQTAEQRVAYLLLKLAGKLGQQQEVGLLIQTPLTRDDIAEMVAITPETASRVISSFEKQGWIETGRQWIALANLPALQELTADI